ncbi:MAG: radical SAM protein, partial [Elusimicrobiota bacterium]|nr:radical SAM protein [Elusimicrobiota bacterium]
MLKNNKTDFSKRFVQRILQEVYSETLPYSPPIYPPPQAWAKISNDILFRAAWKSLAKTKNAPVDLYVHLPFCASICNFCGMNSILLSKSSQIDEYLNALKIEVSIIGGLLSSKKISSVRVGGGTPSLLSEGQIRRLFNILFDAFKFKKHGFGNYPISIVFEGSPYSLDMGKLKALKENNVNGIALGVQSLDDEVLRLAGRLQTKAQVREVIKNARKAKFEYVSVDLMYGIKGQTEKSFFSDIKTMIKWGVDRIVLYGFSPTKHTRFVKEGGFFPEERQKEISEVVEKGVEIINSRGYKSDLNESEANSGIRDCPGYNIYEGSYLAYGEQDEEGYWHSIAGLGLGAISSIMGKARYSNHGSLEAYLNILKRKKLPVEKGVKLTPIVEMINFILRIMDDREISIKNFKKEFNVDIKKKFPKQLRDLVLRGIIREYKGKYVVDKDMDSENLLFEINYAFFEKKILKNLQIKYGLSENDVSFRPVPNELEPNIFLTDKCNQKCLFCSSMGEDRLQTKKEIKHCLINNKNTVSIEGGEPTLSKDLGYWVRTAKNIGVKDIILCTNGSFFPNKKRVFSLVEDGVTLFNINFPSHIEKVFNLITQTKGQFEKRVSNL